MIHSSPWVYALFFSILGTTRGLPFSSSNLQQPSPNWRYFGGLRKQLSSRKNTRLFESSSLGDNNGRTRDLTSLKDWAMANGVQLLPGIELVQEPDSQEWGVTNTRPLLPATFQGLREVSAMSIPTSLILTSTSIQNPAIQPALATQGMEYYAPEFCLFWILLLEQSKGERSNHYAWIQSLPQQISTVIYFDDTERAYARQLGAGKFLDHQDFQWQAFQQCLQQVFPDHGFDVELQKWSFAVVLTRSWRTSYPDATAEAVAVLVPMADMFNHNTKATVQVKQETAQDAVTILLKKTIAANHNEGLFLNYGLPEHADRYPMIFGFCDTSSPSVCASSILELFRGDDKAGQLGFHDSGQMVFNTKDGSVSETLWIAVLYKILQGQLNNNNNLGEDSHCLQADLETIQTACVTLLEDPTSESTACLKEVHQRYRPQVVDFLRHKVEDILTGQFGPIPDFTESDCSSHPNLETMMNYHQHMRSIHQRVQQFLLLQDRNVVRTEQSAR